MNNEIKGSEVLERMAKTDERIADISEEVKSMGANLTKTTEVLTTVVSELKEKTEAEEVKSLKAQVEAKSAEANNLQERIKALSAGHSAPSAEEFKSVFAQGDGVIFGMGNTQYSNLKSILEQKSNGIVAFDARRGGIFVKNPAYSEIINLSPRANGISNLIRTVDTPFNEKFITEDSSFTVLKEKIEHQVSPSGKGSVYGQFLIDQTKKTIKIPVSSQMVQNSMRGLLDFDIVAHQINELVDLYNYEKDKDIVIETISKSQSAGSIIYKTASAANDAVSVTDVLEAYSKLPQLYRTRDVVFVADQAYVDTLFAKDVGTNGQLKRDYYRYTNDGGVINIATGSGIVRVVGVDSSFFVGYKKFNDNGTASTTDITSGFNFNLNNNAGKVLGMFLDTQRSSVIIEDKAGFSAELYYDKKDDHNEGAFFGLNGSYGFGITRQATISLLFNKN